MHFLWKVKYNASLITGWSAIILFHPVNILILRSTQRKLIGYGCMHFGQCIFSFGCTPHNSPSFFTPSFSLYIRSFLFFSPYFLFHSLPLPYVEILIIFLTLDSIKYPMQNITRRIFGPEKCQPVQTPLIVQCYVSTLWLCKVLLQRYWYVHFKAIKKFSITSSIIFVLIYAIYLHIKKMNGLNPVFWFTYSIAGVYLIIIIVIIIVVLAMQAVSGHPWDSNSHLYKIIVHWHIQ